MKFVISCIAAIVVVANLSEATLIIGTTAAATAGVLTLTGGSAAALGLVGGVGILKALVLGAAFLSAGSRGSRGSRGYRGGSRRFRGRRSIEDDDAIFAVLSNSEPAQCYRRLICDLASGAIPDNDNILNLFNEDVAISSPKFEFATAAKIGKTTKVSQMCEFRYSCPLSTAEMQNLLTH